MYVFGTETHMTAIVGMALGKREVPKDVGFNSNAAANMFFKAQDKVANPFDLLELKCLSPLDCFLQH